MPSINVINLRTSSTLIYDGISPFQAVICAYAQGRGDWNTWDYKKYEPCVEFGKHFVFCGDWGAKKET